MKFKVSLKTGSLKEAFDWKAAGVPVPNQAGSDYLRRRCIQILSVSGENAVVKIWDMTDDVVDVPKIKLDLGCVVRMSASDYKGAVGRSKKKSKKRSKKSRKRSRK